MRLKGLAEPYLGTLRHRAVFLSPSMQGIFPLRKDSFHARTPLVAREGRNFAGWIDLRLCNKSFCQHYILYLANFEVCWTIFQTDVDI
jgi:hypothetical protein